MRIVTFTKIKNFVKDHPDSDIALKDWYLRTKRSEWNNLSDIKQTFNSVDYVGNNRYIFNIKGNNYRLIAILSFNAKKVYIRFIGTHKEYDKINDIKNI